MPETGVVSFLGPSGSGKTTMLRLIAGLDTPDSGYVTGREQYKLSMLFQEDRLLPWRTAAENVMLVIAGRGRGSQSRGMAALMSLSDSAGLYPHELSGGMQRRLSLARALAYAGGMLILASLYGSGRAAAGADNGAHIPSDAA